MTSKKIADPSFITTWVTGEENIFAKTDAEGTFWGTTPPAMHRAALTRETTRVKSTSVLENEISVFSHFERPAKIFDSQLSRSKSSNQKRSPTRYSSPGKLRIFPPVLPTSVANVKKPTAPPRFSAVSRQNSAGSSSCALRNHCMACTIVRRQASVNRLPRGGSPSLRRHAR